MSLYNELRPATFDNMVGNQTTIAAIKAAINRPEGPPHTWLLTGPFGCGKTTVARIIAEHLDGDVSEYDMGQLSGVDAMRDLQEAVKMTPLEKHRAVIIMDEVHCLTTAAENCILKLLEEPPKHVIFILCTTDPQKVSKGILTRCASFTLNPLDNAEVLDLLDNASNQLKIDLPMDVAVAIAKACDGSSRMALSMLDAVRSLPSDQMLGAVTTFTATEASAKDIVQALKRGASWQQITALIKAINTDPEQFRRGMLGYLSAVLMNSGDAKDAKLLANFKEPVYNTGKPGIVLAIYNAYRGQ